MENYNKLLEKAQKAYKNCVTDAEKRRLESIFPELKMSEDERIKKEIIEFLQLPHRKFVGERNQEEWIEWLQKQNEKTLTIDVDSMVEAYRQKHLNQGIAFKNSPVTNMCVNMCVAAYKRGIENTLDELYLKQSEQNSTPRFKVGDWIVFNNDHDSVYQVEKIENYEYTLRHILGGSMCLSFSHENMIRAWTIEDVKDGDVLGNCNIICIFRKIAEEHFITTYCLYSDDGCFAVINDETIGDFELKPATKEQRDLLFSKMREVGYEWNANKKELKKIEKNPAWSEKDEERIEQICEDLKCGLENFRSGKNVKGLHFEEIINSNIDWLKSLKPQQKQEWSEEDEKIMKQIDSLLYCQCTIHSSMYEKLHNWLKSLKPQPQWKPTAEQMQSLYFAIITYSKKDDCKLTYDGLNSLYDNLKKL